MRHSPTKELATCLSPVAIVKSSLSLPPNQAAPSRQQLSSGPPDLRHFRLIAAWGLRSTASCHLPTSPPCPCDANAGSAESLLPTGLKCGFTVEWTKKVASCRGPPPGVQAAGGGGFWKGTGNEGAKVLGTAASHRPPRMPRRNRRQGFGKKKRYCCHCFPPDLWTVSLYCNFHESLLFTALVCLTIH